MTFDFDPIKTLLAIYAILFIVDVVPLTGVSVGVAILLSQLGLKFSWRL